MCASADTVRPYSVHPEFPARWSVAFYYALAGDRPNGKASEAGSVGRSVGSVSLANASGSRCGRRRRRGEDAIIVGTPPARSRRPRLTPPISARRPSVRASGGRRLQGRRDVLALRATDACESFVCSLSLSPSLSIRDLMAGEPGRGRGRKR